MVSIKLNYYKNVSSSERFYIVAEKHFNKLKVELQVTFKADFSMSV